MAASNQRRPHSSARARQSSRSSGASDGETAVTHRTGPAPSVSVATRARKAESAPPLKATTTRPRVRSTSRSASSRSPVPGSWRGAGVWRVLDGIYRRATLSRTTSTSSTMPVKKGPKSA